MAVLTSVVLAGCGGGGGEGGGGTPTEPTTPSGPVVATVTVSLSAATVQVNSTVQATATVRSTTGADLQGRAIQWSSSNTGVAEVSSSGVVRGVTAGTAIIRATSEGKLGEATVTVTPIQNFCSTTTLAGTVTIGQRIDGNLSTTDCTLAAGAYADLYRLDVSTATALRISLQSATFDPVVVLYDAGGNVITSDDDSGDGLNSLLDRSFSPGTYYVGVRATGAPNIGSYSLLVTSTAPTTGSCSTNSLAGTLLPGNTASGVLTTSDCVLGNGGTYADLYRMTLNSQQAVKITLATTAFDGVLVLYGQDGSFLLQDNNSGGGNTAQISATLAGGTYYIAVTSTGSPNIGTYSVSVQ